MNKAEPLVSPSSARCTTRKGFLQSVAHPWVHVVIFGFVFCKYELVTMSHGFLSLIVSDRYVFLLMKYSTHVQRGMLGAKREKFTMRTQREPAQM
jgi:hypothetical protein